MKNCIKQNICQSFFNYYYYYDMFNYDYINNKGLKIH